MSLSFGQNLHIKIQRHQVVISTALSRSGCFWRRGWGGRSRRRTHRRALDQLQVYNPISTILICKYILPLCDFVEIATYLSNYSVMANCNRFLQTPYYYQNITIPIMFCFCPLLEKPKFATYSTDFVTAKSVTFRSFDQPDFLLRSEGLEKEEVRQELFQRIYRGGVQHSLRWGKVEVQNKDSRIKSESEIKIH